MKIIDSFKGEYRWLSNFSEDSVRYNGLLFETNEHFYQCMKHVWASDGFVEILTARGARKAKQLSKKFPQDLRAHWKNDRVHWMLVGLRLKFSQNPDTLYKLERTGKAILIEGNDWGDEFWGCTLVDGGYLGLNMLGTLLMMVRQEMRGGF